MKKSIKIFYKTHNHILQLKNFMNILLSPLHKNPLKTLQLLTATFVDIRKPVLCELARQLPVPVKFKTNLNRLWRFFAKSKFTLEDAYAGIIPYFLEWLKSRKYLEILIDWTKVGNYSVLYLSLPYQKRAIPLFWRVVDYLNDEHWQNRVERECLGVFISLVPQYLWRQIVIVADRGFGKVEFIKFLKGLGVNFVIRVKGDVWVKYGRFSGCIKGMRLGKNETMWWQEVLYHKVVQERINLVLRYDSNDPWYLVTDLADSEEVIAIYGHRMRIEESFRDFKNERYFSLRAAGLKGVVKMEKLILVAVVAYMFVILLGAVSERIKEFIDLVSMVKKGKKKLLSSFRLGLELLNKLDLSKYPWLFHFKKLCPTES